MPDRLEEASLSQSDQSMGLNLANQLQTNSQADLSSLMVESLVVKIALILREVERIAVECVCWQEPFKHV
jgi:hypothetical protein